MKSAVRFAGMGMVGALALAAGTAQSGDSPAEASDTQLTTIIVTAQKRSEDIQSVPFSISVVDSQQLEDMHATQLLDYASYIPGVTLSSFGAPGQSQIALRGIPPLGSSGTVATYIDDTPLSSSSLYGAGASSTLDLLPYDFQNFEVLRGPQGTLYGASSLGGLIKYVTRSPDLDKSTVDFGADLFGINGANKAGFGERIRVNTPLVPGQLAMSFSASQQNTPGYIDNVQLQKGGQNAFQQQAARLALYWQPTGNFSLKLSAMQQRVSDDSSSYVALDPTGSTPVYGRFRNNNYMPESVNSTLQYFSAAINWDVGWADFVSATSYSDTHQLTVTDTTFTYGVLLPLFGAPPGISAFDSTINLDKTTQEFRLASKPGEHFEWLAGVFYDNEESTQNQLVTANSFSGVPVAGFDPLAFAGLPSTYREYAVFGDLTYKLNTLFDITAGGRWARNNQTFAQISGGAILPVAVVPGTSKQATWTYSVSPRLHITPDNMVYLRVATGYQPGGPNVFLPGIPPQVGADTITNYEVGLKSLFADRRVMIDVDAFYIDWHKIQVSASNGVASYIVNGGTARSDGFELSSEFKPIDRLQLGFNATYTNAKLTEDVPSIGGVSGDPLPYIPKWAASATANYSIPLVNEWQARMGIGAHYTGSTETAVAHSPLAYPLASSTGIDLNADVENDHWTVRLFVKNLANRDSYVNSTPIQSAATGAVVQVRGVPLQPRTVGIGVDAKF